ncbi:MAG: LPS export ABC transporter periplasmic protein LptC [Comamonadaceae bacterium CG1_02_60_18]|nr:MAG: LPS export ABC transporter periplasmic protein LptC [Comamonadaceae bacterium CG1_02_60_18]PIQ52136.1 MAG: LPS export ABC transporter periplasmic protein LptC [Comamonadaceae bacterium CG12_big_fil_rev_8_21_14_0_65_59_15]
MTAWLRLLLDRLTLYLPVVLMGALAMSTYWLARTSPVAGAAASAPAVRHLPDYFMREFAVQTFDAQGRLKSEVSGKEARHFPDTDTLEIDQAQIRSYDAQGALTTASARQAISNGDGSEVKLMGGARVVRAATVSPQGKAQPELTFAGEFLHAFVDAQRVVSDQPVVLTRGADRFSAQRMDFDNRQRVVQLGGRVQGVLVPSASP